MRVLRERKAFSEMAVQSEAVRMEHPRSVSITRWRSLVVSAGHWVRKSIMTSAKLSMSTCCSSVRSFSVSASEECSSWLMRVRQGVWANTSRQ